MGMGERNRLPPVPGGVIWWDQKGVQQHTPYPPGSPLRGAIVLFMVGGFVGLQCIMFFVMAVTLEQTTIVIGGVVCVIISALLIGGGCKCYHTRKKHVLTLFYPTSGAVEYIMGCRTLYQPPPDYTPPPGFNPPPPGTLGASPLVVQPGAVAYNPAAPQMPPQGGQPYYPGAGVPPPGQQPYYNPTPQPGQQPSYNPSAPPPPGGTGQMYPGYGPPTGYATQYWDPSQPSNPPPQETGKQDTSNAPPPAYNQAMNKV